MNLLKVKWAIAGIDAPLFAWVAALLLLSGSIFLIFLLWWLVRRESQIHREAIRHIKKIHSEFPMRPGEGLSASAYDDLSQFFERVPALASGWRNFTSQIIRQHNTTGDDEYWSPESTDGSFSDEAVIEARLNRNAFIAIPGIITGLGLLVTFSRIFGGFIIV